MDPTNYPKTALSRILITWSMLSWKHKSPVSFYLVPGSCQEVHYRATASIFEDARRSRFTRSIISTSSAHQEAKHLLQSWEMCPLKKILLNYSFQNPFLLALLPGISGNCSLTISTRSAFVPLWTSWFWTEEQQRQQVNHTGLAQSKLSSQILCIIIYREVLNSGINNFLVTLLGVFPLWSD